jgi:hypothetical protein
MKQACGLRMTKRAIMNGPRHLCRLRKISSASIFEGGDISRGVVLDDLRCHVLILGDLPVAGHAPTCPAASGTSSWACNRRHNRTRVSPTRTAGWTRATVLAFSSFSLFRACASAQESWQFSQPTAALSSVARSPVDRPPASASGRLYGGAIPERSSP